MRCWIPAVAVTAALAVVMPAAAQQVPAEWVPLPHPTDSGKPPIYDPQFARKAEGDQHTGCTPGLECRIRLLGVIQNNGAVELQATAIKW